jgi:hypothetical protein
MRFSNKWAVSLLVPGLLAAAWCWAAPAPNDKPPDAGPELVVHEWGTFSTFSGSDGKNLKFFPYDNDLPDFVHGYLPKNSKAGPEGGTISLETPVVYFYPKKELTASLRVDFPRGILTEWYPQAGRTDTRLTWQGVQVLPGQDLQLPAEAKKSRYYAARETDAASLRVALPRDSRATGEQEKFLFYRGVGTFDMPLSARAQGGGKITVRWEGEEAPGNDLFLVQVQAGKLRFQPFRLDRRVKGGLEGDVQVPASESTAADLGAALVKSLTARGLFEKEARAMVKTWSSAWFGEEGTRVLYLLPGSLTDELLPLRVEPKPASLVRVLVGRHDVLTPEREKQIDTCVTVLSRGGIGAAAPAWNAAAAEMNKLGRYQGAAYSEAQVRLKGRR